MKTEVIIESLNRYIEKERERLKIDSNNGHVVLHKTIEQNPSFKIYKTFTATIWYVKGRKKVKLFTTQLTDRVTEETEDRMWEKINMELFINIFNLIKTETFNKVIEGKIEDFYEIT